MGDPDDAAIQEAILMWLGLGTTSGRFSRMLSKFLLYIVIYIYKYKYMYMYIWSIWLCVVCVCVDACVCVYEHLHVNVCVYTLIDSMLAYRIGLDSLPLAALILRSLIQPVPRPQFSGL